MTALKGFRATLLTIALALASFAAAPAQAQSPSYVQMTGSDVASRPIYLGVNKSVVVDLPRSAGDVLVSNPRIADAVLRTSNRLYLIGVSLGQASIFLFDDAGAQIASFDIYVEADLSSLNQLLAEAVTGGYVRADAVNGSIVLRGQVASATDASRAEEITRRMLPAFATQVSAGSGAGNDAGSTSSFTTTQYDSNTGPQIVNLLNITGEEQVALKVTIAEVQRSVVKQLGINVSGGFNSDDLDIGTGVGGASAGGLSPLGGSLGVNATAGEVGLAFSSGSFDIKATLQALDEANMIRTLAEPTLTAVSGETADFLAGGEVPFITGIDQDTGIVSVDFKKFGVQLAFTPVVLSAGRINLKVRSEVSEVTGFTSSGNPILSTRRAETTVEQPSGGSFVIAGLLKQTSQSTAGGFPGIRNIPIIGALFSSKAYLANETELVMIVTPYLVKPVSPQALARPDDNLFMASDAETYFLNRLTKVYGHGAKLQGGAASSQVGFTFD